MATSTIEPCHFQPVCAGRSPKRPAAAFENCRPGRAADCLRDYWEVAGPSSPSRSVEPATGSGVTLTGLERCTRARGRAGRAPTVRTAPDRRPRTSIPAAFSTTTCAVRDDEHPAARRLAGSIIGLSRTARSASTTSRCPFSRTARARPRGVFILQQCRPLRIGMGRGRRRAPVRAGVARRVVHGAQNWSSSSIPWGPRPDSCGPRRPTFFGLQDAGPERWRATLGYFLDPSVRRD